MVKMALKWRYWRPVAITTSALGLLLIAGKWVPLPMVSGQSFIETIETCKNGLSGFYDLFISCPQPMLLHKELGGTALLGSVAILVFLALWLRRRMTNERRNDDLGRNSR
jgi:hypothetical protein